MIKKFIKDTKARIIPYTVMIMLIMVAISGIFLNYNDVTKASEKSIKTGVTTLWLPTDAHVGRDGLTTNYEAFYMAINDSNEIGVDYCFEIGDCIHGNFSGSYNYSDQWDMFYDAFNSLNCNYKNITIGGNHDRGWKGNTTLDPTYYGNYTYQFGNVLVIALMDEVALAGGHYANQLSWFNDTVQSNQDKNIIVLSHYPVEATTLGSKKAGNPIIESADYVWILEHYNVSLWATGHIHGPHSATQTALGVPGVWFNDSTGYGVTSFLGCDCLATHGGDVGPSDVESRYLFFTDGSSEVVICSFNHTSRSWQYQYNYSFNLTYPFDSGENYEPMISINDLLDGSTISDNNRNFNWTKNPFATRYQLQIANDTEFNDIFYDKNDINATNYASQYYNEVGNYVNFNITNIYNEGARRGDTHYYRVRAYVGD